MKVQARQCDARRIADFIDGRLSEPEQAVLEEHLSDCAACRASLGAQTADDEVWDKASRYLRDEDEELESLSGTGDSAAECDQNYSIQHVLDALAPTDDPAMLGRLGAYEISGVVGSGGMGVVLKALDKSLDRTVAIKVMAPHLATNGAARKRFAREAKAAAAVLHPNVMAIHSVSSGDSLPFLVMPYMRGTSLQKRLDAEGPLPVGEILRIGAQTAAGLAAAHAQGLIHRDIKPANILLEEGVERVAITDFGLARAVDDATMTRTGVVAGTPQYMSPEQARGEPLDQSSDLFSLGSVLYAMCTGRPPFRAESSYGVLRRITDEEPKSIREINPDIPEWLRLLISRLMAKSPAARFGNALEVAALLEQCLAHVQQPTSVSLPASLVLRVAGRRSIFNFTRKGVFVMLGTIGMTLLGMVLWQATEAPDISGQWTSDEWGTVVLEAKGSREYEGTFTGSGKDKPVPSNDPPVGGAGDVSLGSGSRINISAIGPAPLALDFPGGRSDGLGVSPKSKPDALSDSDKTNSGTLDLESPQKFHSIIGVIVDGELKHYDSGANFPLPTVRVLDKTKSGTVHLKWSRVERRFNGTWGKGVARSGTMSLRLLDKEIRGGFTTEEEVQLETGTPLVGDLLWKRSAVTVPDGGNVLLGGTKTTEEAANTSRKVAPGEILVEIYGGRGIYKSLESRNDVGKLLLALQAVKGVTIDIHEDGEGDAVTKAVVHMPAHAAEKNAESTKQEALIRTIKSAIDEALRTHRVPDVRWLDGIGKQQYFPAEWSEDPKPVATHPPAAPGKQQKQPSQTSVTFQAIMFDMDAELITEFPVGMLQHLYPTNFGEQVKQMIDKGRVTIVSEPQIRTQIGETSTVQIGMSIAVRSPDKREMTNRIVGETLLMTPREVDGEIVLDIQFTSEQPLKDIAQSADDVTLQSNTFSFRVPLKKYERNGVVLGPFVMPNKKLRCIHLVKDENSVDQQNASLNADRELKKFLEANPKSIGSPPLTDNGSSGSGIDWSGYARGPHALRIIERLKPAWSDTKFGIAFGVSHTTDQQKFNPGERVPLAMFVRNTGDATLKVSLTDDFYWNVVELHDAWGVSIPVERVELQELNRVYSETLKPGEAFGFLHQGLGLHDGKPRPVPFSLRGHRLEETPPYWKVPVAGTYTLRQTKEITIEGLKDTVTFRGPLTSGTVAFEVVESAPDAEKVSGIAKPLDRQNARAVVEAFVAAAIAGDEITINALAPISRSQAGVELYVGELKFLKLAKLPIESVYVKDLAKPTKALATSVEVRLEGKTPRRHEARVGFLVLTLSMSENGWSVTDIDFDSKEGSYRELMKFLEANPKAISVPPQASSEAAKSATGLAEKKTVISDLGLWVVPASAEEVLTLGVTRTPAVPGGVRVTKIVPGGYIDTQIKAGKLKFEVGEIVHSVAARDVTSANDVSRNILSTRREGHSGFFIGTASPTGLGRFSVEFSELLTDPKTGEIQLPPLQFHIVAANAVKDPVDESGHA